MANVKKKKVSKEQTSEVNIKAIAGRKGGLATKRRNKKLDPNYYRNISLMRKTFGSGRKKAEK